MAIGEHIKRLRQEKGWSQAQLANKLSVHQKQISGYERNVHVPSTDVIIRMANAFGVTLDYLVDETGSVAEVTSKEMLDRITEIDHLDQEDKKTIIHVIDSLLRDAKARKAYSSHA